MIRKAVSSAWKRTAGFLWRASPRREGTPAWLSPQVLAYVGDAVFEVYIRTHLVVEEGPKPVTELHRRAISLARARGQADLLQTIEPLLSEEEIRLVRRGRNAGGRVPKGSTTGDYRQATGLETLLGALYLEGKMDRLQEIMAEIRGQF